MNSYLYTVNAGHVGIVYSLTVLKAPGKMRLFSASYDKTIRVSTVRLCSGASGKIVAVKHLNNRHSWDPSFCPL